MSSPRTWHLSRAEEPAEATLRLKRTGGDAALAQYDVEVEGRQVRCQAALGGEDRVVLIVDGVSHTCHMHRADDETWLVHVDGHTLDVGLLSERAMRRRLRTGGGGLDDSPLVASPMAGRIVAVRAQAGAAVEPGQTLLIIEAMKMENDIKATRAGVVESVHVAAGDAVEVGTQLLRFAASTAD